MPSVLHLGALFIMPGKPSLCKKNQNVKVKNKIINDGLHNVIIETALFIHKVLFILVVMCTLCLQ